MTNLEIIQHCLPQIPPAELNYLEWLKIGAAIKHEGGSCSIWDEWSRKDARYRQNEPARKWDNLDKGMDAVTVATVIDLCKQHGGTPPRQNSFNSSPDDNSEISFDTPFDLDKPVVRREWLEIEHCPLNVSRKPEDQLADYIKALFTSDECVGYVTDSFQTDPDQAGNRQWRPKSKGIYSKTAQSLQDALAACSGDLGQVIGDWNDECGAWIRFNPLDGKGASDSNVTDYRFALVESDEMSIDEQYSIIRKMELPCAALVWSGGKSLHAIVRIDAGTDYREYQKRVDWLYEICKKNGLPVDRKNRNPSRLSRMPGISRHGKIQSLVAVDIGKSSWAEWADWIAAQNDELPDITPASDLWQNVPPLSDELIGGVLRVGHKLLLSGPSKAGKSFLLMELAVAIASGTPWVGLPCRQGRVLYVNLEIDHVSFLHRLKEIYQAKNLTDEGIENIDVWDLRGNSCPMDVLAPRLIRRSLKRRYAAVIIDPIYKVITGDENSAEQMAKFFNQFDKICRELKCSTIMVHHHSKGTQGQKMAQDRGSGSGVFARDPDAILDLVPLVMNETRRTAVADCFITTALEKALHQSHIDFSADLSEDDLITPNRIIPYACKKLGSDKADKLVQGMREMAEHTSGWRMEGILREFPEFGRKHIFFSYPLHIPDKWGVLSDALAPGEMPPKAPKKTKEAKESDRLEEIAMAFNALEETGQVKTQDMAEYMSVSATSVRGWFRRYASRLSLKMEKNIITRKK